MQDLEFEWDEPKSDQVNETRGFDFGFAATAFLDPQAIHQPDTRRAGSSARFKITPDGALLKERPSGGGWVHTAPRVDFERLDATTDSDISHQRIAELIDEAMQASTSTVAQLAEALHLSPSTIRRWRRGAASPTAANLQRLQERVSISL